MICFECLEYIDPKIKDSFKVLSRQNKMYCCNSCFEGLRFKELILKSGLSKSEKEEMFSYKRVMDTQNKKIQEMLLKLFKITGINMF
tara:strand:+ start:178 stop:438 length:261 start_codon:yes stop_codon:yes gene_type:complete